MISNLPEGLSDGQNPPVVVQPAQSILYSPRILSLDVLRGIAVLAALFIGIWGAGGFSSNQQNGLLIQSKGFDYRLYGTVDLLFQGKMRALIALVFGAGMLLFLSKDQPKSQVPSSDLFIRRQLWLLLFGLVNAMVFLWTGDILFHLAIMGILLFPFVRLSARGLLIAAILTTIIYSGKNYWNYADDKKAYKKYLAVTALETKIAKNPFNLSQSVWGRGQKKDTLTSQQKKDKAAWEGIVGNLKYDSKKDVGEKKTIQNGSYGMLWNHLLPATQTREARWTYRFGIWDFSSMILMGMALFKLGFFSGRLTKKKYLFLAITGLTFGLLLGWFRLNNNQLTLHDYAKYIDRHLIPYNLFFSFERAFMVLGYASLILFLLAAGLFSRLWKGFANVGRMALTNYLMQSIICTLFFMGFGMGYFGRLGQYQLYMVVFEICIVQIVFSILWLRFYQYGPAEWIWRCLIYKTWLPNRIRKPELTEPSIPVLS